MTLQDIDVLWGQHKQAPFPVAASGAEVEGINLVLLDADTSGCVSYFLGCRRLDKKRCTILQNCEKELRTIAPKLRPQIKPYFERLSLLAAAVLEAVVQGSGV